MIILKHYKEGECTSFVFLMAILIEASRKGCRVIEWTRSPKSEDDAANINAIVDWLADSFPNEYKIGRVRRVKLHK